MDKAEGIVYKLIEGLPQSSVRDTVKNTLHHVFNFEATKMHAATLIHPRPNM